MIDFKCKSCGQAMSVPESLIGKMESCQRCGAPNKVPGLSLADIDEMFDDEVPSSGDTIAGWIAGIGSEKPDLQVFNYAEHASKDPARPKIDPSDKQAQELLKDLENKKQQQ